MAARQISDISVETEGGLTKSYAKSEWLIDSSSDTANIPKVAPGSVAYTADLTYMAMYDGTQWVQIGGSGS